jgi:hypothetical protein
VGDSFSKRVILVIGGGCLAAGLAAQLAKHAADCEFIVTDVAPPQKRPSPDEDVLVFPFGPPLEIPDDLFDLDCLAEALEYRLPAEIAWLLGDEGVTPRDWTIPRRRSMAVAGDPHVKGTCMGPWLRPQGNDGPVLGRVRLTGLTTLIDNLCPPGDRGSRSIRGSS